jgi:hypothetical protein
MTEITVSIRCFARIVLAARIENVPVEDFVERVVDEYIAAHRDELLEAHRTEATILLAERPWRSWWRTAGGSACRAGERLGWPREGHDPYASVSADDHEVEDAAVAQMERARDGAGERAGAGQGGGVGDAPDSLGRADEGARDRAEAHPAG